MQMGAEGRRRRPGAHGRTKGDGDGQSNLGKVMVLDSTIGRFGLTEQTEIRPVDNVEYQILPERMTADVPPSRHWSAPRRSP